MPTRVPTADDLRTYNDTGYIILRQAFSPQRIKAMVDALNRLIDRALAGDVEMGWLDREQRLPARISHMLHPDKYDPAWADWLAYKAEIRKPYKTERGVKCQLTRISKWGSRRAVAAIEYSIAQEFQGVYEERGASQQYGGAVEAAKRYLENEGIE